MRTAFLVLALLAACMGCAWAQTSNTCGMLTVCNDDACGNAFVSYAPSGQNVFCEGAVITLSNNSTTLDFQSFQIDWGDGQVETVTNYNNVTHTYNYAGIDRCAEGPIFNQTICYVGRKTCPAGESCNTATAIVSVRLRPVARFEVPGEVCIGNALSFSNTSCNVPESGHLWNFGDGNTSTQANPNHTYATPGNYTVTLTVTNTCGSDTQTRMVRAVAPPQAGFTQSATTGCGPTVINFTGQANQWSNTLWVIMPNDTSRWEYTDTLMNAGSTNVSIRFKVPGEYTVTQRASNICGTDEQAVTITIYQPPMISLTAPPVSCDELTLTSGALNFTSSGAITGYNWTFENGTPATATGPTFSGVVFTQSGTVTLTIESPCGPMTQSVPVTVAGTTPVVIGSTPATLCDNAMPITLQATPAGGQWSGNGITAAGVLNPAGLAAGTYTYTYSSGAVQCPNAGTTTIEILPAPGVSLPSVPTACESLGYLPMPAYTGTIGTYAWAFPGGVPATSTQANPGTVQYDTPGSYQATVTVSGACGTAADTVDIVVQANVALEITPPVGPLCSGSSPITLVVNQPGGTWSGNGITDPVAGVFDPGSVTPGQPTTLQYTLSGGACTASANLTVTVVASATVSLPADTFCIDSAPRQLAVSPMGGGFAGTPGVTTGGVFDPAQAGIGTSQVTYNLTDANGCEVMATAGVLVEALPQLTIAPSIPLCLSSIDVDLGQVTGIVVDPAGGTLVWSGPGVTSPTGVFNAGGLAEGSYELTVEYRRNDCMVQRSFMVEITEPQPLSIGADMTVCISEQFLQLTANLAGGTWSGPGIGPDGRIDLQAAGGNVTHGYSYQFGAGTNCAQSAAILVEILDPGALVNAGPDVSVCVGPSTYTLTGASPAPGLWEGAGVTDAVAGVLDLAALVPDSVYVMQYCIESAALAGCSACDSRTFVLYANPVAEFALEGTACINETFGVENNSAGADQFAWNFGDGSVGSTLASPTHQYANPGDYTIRLIATNTTTTCRDTATLDLFVTSPPVAAFNLDEDEGCAPFEVVIQDGSSGFDVTRTWFVGDSVTVGMAPTGIRLDSITQDSTFIIRLVASNLCGDRVAEAPVLVRPYPIVRFGVFPQEGCSPLTVELSNAVIGNPDIYFWDLGNGSTSTDSLPPFPTYTTGPDVVSTYLISLTASNACGTRTLAKEVTVYPPDVTAFIEASPLVGCQPLLLSAESFSTPGAIPSWLVIGPDGNQQGSAVNAPQFTLDVPGLHTVILYASRCGTDADTVMVEVLPAPAVSFTHRPFICAGQPIAFTNTSVDISGSEWDFGDGQTSTDASPAHTYSEPGEYTVTLTAYSLVNNCPATFTSTVTVVGNPVAAFTPSATNGCGPLTLAFSSESTPGVNHVWDFGDGSSAAFEANPTHTFQNPGNYLVRLTVYDADSCFTSVAQANIFVFPDPVAGFGLPDGPFCVGHTTLQPTNASVDAVAYEWYWQTDTFTVASPSVVPTAAGQFALTLVVANTFGCRDTFSRLVDILPSPVAVPLPTVTAGCQPLRVGFGNQSQHATNFLWAFGDGNASNAPTPTHDYTGAGTFEGTLVAASTNGCPPDTAAFSITVWPKPVAAFQMDRAELCGAPLTVGFVNESAFAEGAEWVFGDGATSTVLSPSHTYTSPGVYAVRLIATNSFGCRDTSLQQLDVYGRPVADFALPSPAGCEDYTVTFQNLSTEALAYEWRIAPFPDVFTEPTPTVTFTEPGAYEVSLIAIYNDLCRDTLRLPGYVRVFTSPVAAFSYVADEIPNVLGDVAFTNLSSGAERFFWDLGDGTTTTLTNPTHEYSINRDIEVMLVAYNDNGGALTCTDTTVQAVAPEWITTFFAPNALSPDAGADGVRVFRPVGIGMSSYRMAVYSPWGEQVWYSEALDETNGSPTDAWDGTLHNQGRPVPQGTYTWRADIVFVNGSTLTRTGNVTVLR